jgi:hypothetical protein
MKVPVYPRGADPRVARPILRKSHYYAAEQVLACRADWVDSEDPRKGIVPREFLPSGKVYGASAEQIELLEELGPPPDAGLRFIPPPMEQNPTLPRINIDPLCTAAPSWDWSYEGAPA